MKGMPGKPVPWCIRMARIGDAPIYVHFSMLLVFLYFLFKASIPIALWGMLLLTALVVVHEAGHALVCRLVGAEVNFLYITPLFGQCVYTHLDPQPDERDFILIAWGGVFAQTVLLIISLLGFAIFSDTVFMPPGYVRADGFNFAHMTWLILIAFNAGMIFFNLAPMEPLDGAKAWEMSPWRVVRAMWYGWNASQKKAQIRT